jgi:predicted nucleic acid-binding protein
LCSSHYALEEARINLADEEQRERLTKLSGVLHLFEATQEPLARRISLPEKDAPILSAAIAARATHLLTGDVRHFGPYFGKRIKGIAIMLPRE